MQPALANNGALCAPLAARRLIDDAVMVGLLLLGFVGVTPFHPPPTELLAAGTQTGAGDALRQVLWLLVFASVCFLAWRRHGIGVVSLLPPLLLTLLLWCFASALWSPEPMVTLRRAGLATVLVISAVLGVETAGSERSIVLWRWVLLAVLLVNIASIKFIPAAVHLPSETDPALIGNWRGLYAHKNIAGSVGAMTALLFLFWPQTAWWKKLADLAVVALAVFFTVMTHSKSSLGLLAIAVLAGGIYRLAWRRPLDRLIAVVATLLVLIPAVTVLLADQSLITRLLDDPTGFTGRTEIWKAEVEYVRDHPLFGAGFGTFAGTGGVSPLAHYVGGWVTEAFHGHNGFLQLMVTTGLIGFVLAMLALLVIPAIDLVREGSVEIKALLFSLFVFLVLHNLMETDFLEGDGVTWVAFLLMMAMAAKLARRT